MEWWIGRLCDEFHCLPSEALKEWEQAPAGWLEAILECRAFAAAKRIYDAADTADAQKRIRDDPWVQRVKTIEFALREEEIEQGDG